MDFTQKLLLLAQLQDSKRREYQKAFKHFVAKNQRAITFCEVSRLKEELDELNALIAVVKKVSVS
ncbi:hypothetical protein [Flavobacterium sp. AG291]|uniref:hypothetical protein n=1 Tax=Flavobacterium sp. AG291 TaxID=2184000 RepID=UPI000E0BF85B|nr:hypothetical protein [Flavobacterium sp. AG291]RDI11255.1 hypothetical protein DEU42_106189 [Flavobacterium sp. AG291]